MESIIEILNKIDDSKIVSAIIASISAIVTTLIIKPFIDRKFHVFKLNQEYKSEQRKQIKNTLAKNKVHLLKCAEELNYRLWNFTINHKEGWLDVKGDYKMLSYYFHSFTYLILNFYYWIKITEKQLIYLDTTVSSKEDLDLIKYFRLFESIFCSIALFDGYEYDKSKTTDHFFKGQLDSLSSVLIRDDKTLSYTEYESKYSDFEKDILQLYLYLDCLTPDEKRLRFFRLVLLHYSLIAFLNSYGYDYQYTSKLKIKGLTTKLRYKDVNIINNYQNTIYGFKLHKSKGMKSILNILGIRKYLISSLFQSKNNISQKTMKR